MEKKPGFKIRFGTDTLLYIVIGIIIVAFIIFMPTIYKFISDVKTGNAFKGTVDTPTDNKDKEEPKKPSINEGEIVEPTADTKLVCTLSTSKAEGDSLITYTFYYNTNKLEHMKHEQNYNAITDEYVNYIYLEQSKNNSLYNLYKSVPGFSYKSNLQNKSLSLIYLYDLTKLNPESLKNTTDSLSIKLNVQRNQTLEEVKTLYVGLGYSCK